MGLVCVFQVEIDQGRGIKIRFPRGFIVFFGKKLVIGSGHRGFYAIQKQSCNSGKPLLK